MVLRTFSSELVYYVVEDQTVIDGRRIQGDLNMTKIYSAVSSVTLPNGEYLSPITDEDLLSKAVPVHECYRQAVHSTVVKQDYAKFESSIKKSLIETAPGVFTIHQHR